MDRVRIAIPFCFAVILFFTLAFWGCSSEDDNSAGTDSEPQIDICSLVSAEQLQQIFNKELYATPQRNGCFWSIKPGGMAYLHISLQEKNQDIRSHFTEDLPSHVFLEKISDLGDGGLMSLSEGTLGVIVIEKGDKILKSAATFLEIEPGSSRQRALWDIYTTILNGIRS